VDAKGQRVDRRRQARRLRPGAGAARLRLQAARLRPQADVRGRGGAAPGGAAPAAGAPAAAPAGRGAPAGPPPPGDAQVIKFSKTGAFIMQIGKAGTMGTADSTTALNRPAAVAVDDAANEVYVADTGDHRIAVFDAKHGRLQTRVGRIRRKGVGRRDGRLPIRAQTSRRRQFRDPTCVKIAKDGMVYVCDKGNDRIQVFDKTGKFQKEMLVAKTTTGEGSVSDIAFSADAQQRFSTSRHPGQNGVGARSRVARDGVAGGRGRPLPGYVLRARPRRGRFEGQPVHGRNVRRQARAEVQLQGLGVAPPMNSDEGCSRKRRNGMNRKRNLTVGATFIAALVVLGIGQSMVQKAAAQTKGNMVQVPRFEVDPTFPKPLPNHWYQGQTIGRLGRRAGSRVDHSPVRFAQCARREGARRQDRHCAARKRPPSWSSISRATCFVIGAARMAPANTYKWPSSNHASPSITR